MTTMMMNSVEERVFVLDQDNIIIIQLVYYHGPAIIVLDHKNTDIPKTENTYGIL